MVVSRTCKFRKDDGEPCRAAPLLESEFCFVHAPEYAGEMQEARRLGGLRRRRERTVAGAYDIESIDSVEAIRRVIEIVIFDALGMENTVARGRLLLAASQAGTKLLELGELADRVALLEATLAPRLQTSKRR